jgi:hypothetical protein
MFRGHLKNDEQNHTEEVKGEKKHVVVWTTPKYNISPYLTIVQELL